ncbi:MAG TPA: hypothetical protein VHF89_17695 [Solirubrobacteraceae bacterium]|nr:hypothetical protein [Solirubrobacteraceae bacterium]
MLPQAVERIRTLLSGEEEVLQIGGCAAPFGRADWVLDARPYEDRGVAEGRERFTSRTWLVRDVCAREPWPFDDDRFAFAVCTTLATLRDPIGVCAELSRVARAGYVEVPAIEAELAGGEARWLCDVDHGELVFVHKSPGVASDPRAKVPPRWYARLKAPERVHGLFWEDRLPARERLVEAAELVDELAERLRRRFEPSAAEVAVAEARVRIGTLAGAAAARGLDAIRGRTS